jgi:subtilisin
MKMKKIILLFVACVSISAYFYFQIHTGAESILTPVEQNSETPKPTDSEMLAEMKTANFDSLISKAREYGSARVIVGVKVPFTPAGYLSDAEHLHQRENIKAAQNKLLNELSKFNVEQIIEFEIIPFIVMQASADALLFMKDSPEVTSIREDEARQFHLAETNSQIGTPTAWSAALTGQNQTVAVLDSGVDKNHSFLAGKVVSEACYSFSGTLQGVQYQSVCPGSVNATTAPNSGLPLLPVAHGFDHGTHVAGIIAGQGANFSGVARNASIIAIQVISVRLNDNPQNSCGNFQFCSAPLDSNWLMGLQRVFELRTTYNISAVNMSLGGGSFNFNCDTLHPSATAMIQTLKSVGIATVISSGNNAYNFNTQQYNAAGIGFPACISHAVSVGSVNDGSPDGTGLGTATTINQVSYFSQTSPILNLLAPGNGVTSSLPGNTFGVRGGTSMAAPHVAGAWAIMKQRNPNATVDQILNTFINTGNVIPDNQRPYNLPKPRITVNNAASLIGANCVVNPIGIGQTTSGQTLSNTDCSFTDNLNWHFDYYTFNGSAGQQAAISMNSASFNTLLRLVHPNGQIIAIDDDGGGGTNSRIPAGNGFVTLPVSGVYVILAASNSANSFGAYNLTITANTGCSYTINPTSQNFISTGGTGNINVSAASGCNWSATSNANWITFTSGNSGSGNGSVGFRVAVNSSPLSRTGTITAAGQTFTINQAPRRLYDFDGDLKSDVAVFRPANGGWYIINSLNGSVTGLQFGVNGDLIAPADFDGDGRSDIGVFRPSDGGWYRLNSSNNAFVAAQFGTSGDLPVAGDFDGDGRADVSVFRPSNGSWYRLNSSNGQFVGAQFGANGDKPQVGDFDGDGRSDLAVFRPANGAWYVLRSSDNQFFGVGFGLGSDVPTTADFDGDGRADIAVYRPSVGVWYRLNSSNGQFAAQQFGIAEDKPVAADYDGDGRADVAVFRPSNGTWYLNRSTAQFTAVQFGANGDAPAPAAFGQ